MTKTVAIKIILIPLLACGCASTKSLFGINDSDRVKPIANPFYGYKGPGADPSQNMILRTKKGDRSIELEIPGDSQRLSDFVLPVSPLFKDSSRSPASYSGNSGDSGTPAESVDESYKTRSPSISDREIASSMSHNSPELDASRQAIESSLNLTPSDDDGAPDRSTSYLASLDHVKQLYRASRYEAALLEDDDLIKQYQTDATLYEMRGTLLDRLGKRELAVRAWSQALRLDPKNESLRKFIDRKRQTAGQP